jgi:hypothetical protein
VVHILDKALNRLANDPLAYAARKSSRFIANERLLEYGHKWTVSGKKDCARLAELTAASCDVESDQRLSRARHTRDKHNYLPILPVRAFDNILDGG